MRSCLLELLLGKITFRQFNDYRNLPKTQFDRENGNILIFEDYATVPKQIYLECMEELIRSPDKLYQKMSDQLYYLGWVADKKYTLLRYSYNTFRWGIILSILSFLLIKAMHFYLPTVSQAISEVSAAIQSFQYDDIYESSGVQALPDGRFIVIEDKAVDAMHVMSLNDQDRLLENNRVVEAYSYINLRSAIEQSGILGEVDQQGKGGIVNINIEALSYDRDGRLLIGFRAPLAGNKTLRGVLQNPQAVFVHRTAPEILPQPIKIDLHGGGIRAMSYSQRLRGFLISNEVYGLGKQRKKHSQLIYWDGNPAHRVYHMLQAGWIILKVSPI